MATNLLDALSAAPDNHRLLFENDRVRAWELRLAPGEESAAHRHQLLAKRDATQSPPPPLARDNPTETDGGALGDTGVALG